MEYLNYSLWFTLLDWSILLIVIESASKKESKERNLRAVPKPAFFVYATLLPVWAMLLEYLIVS